MGGRRVWVEGVLHLSERVRNFKFLKSFFASTCMHEPFVFSQHLHFLFLLTLPLLDIACALCLYIKFSLHCQFPIYRYLSYHLLFLNPLHYFHFINHSVWIFFFLSIFIHFEFTVACCIYAPSQKSGGIIALHMLVPHTLCNRELFVPETSNKGI